MVHQKLKFDVFTAEHNGGSGSKGSQRERIPPNVNTIEAYGRYVLK